MIICESFMLENIIPAYFWMRHLTVLPVAFPGVHHLWICNAMSQCTSIKEVKEVLDSAQLCTLNSEDSREQVVNVLL